MCTYLDTVAAMYYFRRTVPANLRPFIRTKSGAPRAEFKISLGTKDRDTAKRLIPDHVKATEAEFDEARRMLAEQTAQDAPAQPASGQADAEVVEAQARFDRLREAQRVRRTEREPIKRELRARLLSFSTSELSPWEGAAKELLMEQMNGTAEAPIAQRRADAVPLLDLFDGYAADAQIKPGTKRDWRKVIEKLIDYLGQDDAARVEVGQLREWARDLLRLPNIQGDFRSPRTVSGVYLAAVRATLGWGLEQGKLSSNAAADVKVRVPKKPQLRDREFTPDEAKRILAASLIPASQKMAVGHQLARRWIPWLCAYTGARVGEMSQLRSEDVTQIEGIWAIRITPEAGTVKTNKVIIAPLHEHLIEQGFLALVAEKSGALFYDPALQRVDSEDSRHIKKVGERLAEWVRKDVMITDVAILPNHAWRHTFKTRALRYGVEGRVADAIQGHAPRSAGEAYGRVDIQTKAAAIGKMPRFELEE